MKRSRKKQRVGRLLGVSLMAFALVLSAIPAEGVIAEEGLQTVSEDSDFLIENGVLTRYTGNGGDVTIPDGVTEIGERAFFDCASLTSIRIPDGVIKLGQYAFGQCSNLTSIIISDSVTEIGAYAFWGCRNLTSVNIPGSVTQIVDCAFWECSSLTTVIMADGVTEICRMAFRGCSSLTSVIIPDSVTYIGNAAFGGCRSLKEITFPESVMEIGIGAICQCENLVDVMILNKSVTLYNEDGCILGLTNSGGEEGYYPNNTKAITFYGYSNSTTQQFAQLLDEHKSEAELNTVRFVALDGSSDDGTKDNVAAVIQEGNNPPTYNGYDSALVSALVNGVKGRPTLRIGAGSGTISEYISNNNLVDSQHDFECIGYNLSLVDGAGNAVTEFTDCIVTLPLPTGWADKNGTFWIGSIKPDGQFDRTAARVVDVEGQKCIQFTTDHFGEYGIVMETVKSGDQDDNTDSDFTIENGVLISYHGGGGDVTIPDGVTEIGRYAFAEAVQLTSITIPDSVTKIGYGAFVYNIGLTSVTIPGSVTQIGDRAFEGCTSLTSITIPESVTQIGVCAIGQCGNLADITILNRNVTLHNGYECILGEGSSYQPTNTKKITFRGYSNSTTQQFAALLDEHKGEAGLETVTFIALDSGSSDDETKDNVEANIEEENNPPGYDGYDRTLMAARVNGVKGTPTLRIGAGSGISEYISSNHLVDSQHGFECAGYNLSLVDRAGNAVTEFRDCTVTLPLPRGWADRDGTLWIGTIKPDGQFERISGSVVDVGEQKCIRFTTNHFGEYGIVMETVKGGNQGNNPGSGDEGNSGSGGTGDGGNGGSSGSGDGGNSGSGDEGDGGSGGTGDGGNSGSSGTGDGGNSGSGGTGDGGNSGSGGTGDGGNSGSGGTGDGGNGGSSGSGDGGNGGTGDEGNSGSGGTGDGGNSDNGSGSGDAGDNGSGSGGNGGDNGGSSDDGGNGDNNSSGPGAGENGDNGGGSGDSGNGDNSSASGDEGNEGGNDASGSDTGSGDNDSSSNDTTGNSDNANSGGTTGDGDNASPGNSAAGNTNRTENTAAVPKSSQSDMSYMPRTGIEDLLFLKNTLVYGTFLTGAILFILSFKKRRI